MATSDVAGTGDKPLRWDLLAMQPPTGEKLTVRTAFPRRSAELQIGLDASGNRHLLIEVPKGEPADLAERASRGIGVQTVEMNVGRGVLTTFVDIACLESYGETALDMIATEILGALEGGASITRVALVQNVLAKWRRFWSGLSHGLMSKESQLGLFGELWFLARWLAPAIGYAEASLVWRGPLNARNDFEWSHVAIEVKTSGRVDGIVHINGLEQLLAPADGSLYLFGMSVREENSATDNLPALVDEIRSGVGDDYETLSRFETALYAAEYHDEFSREYRKLKLRMRREELFEVRHDFPRLTPDSLRNGLPPGISGVTYDLSLDAARQWLVASRAEDATELVTRLFHPKS